MELSRENLNNQLAEAIKNLLKEVDIDDSAPLSAAGEAKCKALSLVEKSDKRRAFINSLPVSSLRKALWEFKKTHFGAEVYVPGVESTVIKIESTYKPKSYESAVLIASTPALLLKLDELTRFVMSSYSNHTQAMALCDSCIQVINDAQKTPEEQEMEAVESKVIDELVSMGLLKDSRVDFPL